MICKKCGQEYGVIEGNPNYCTNELCLQVEVTKIEKPETGGTFTYSRGSKYPYKGYPDANIVGRIASVKRVFSSLLRVCFRKPFIFFLPFLFLFKKRVINEFIRFFGEIYIADLMKHELPEKEMSISVREFLRVGLLFADKIDDKNERFKYVGQTDKELTKRAVWCLAMILEFDSAYRYRVQDILSNINKYTLVQNPRKEILRLVNLALERENKVESQGHKIRLLAKLIKPLLLISPSICRYIKDVFLELNLDKITPDIGDRYYMARYPDYKFFGIPYKERQAWRDKIDKEYKESPEKELDPKVEATVELLPNNYFFRLSLEDSENLIQKIAQTLREDYQRRKVVK